MYMILSASAIAHTRFSRPAPRLTTASHRWFAAPVTPRGGVPAACDFSSQQRLREEAEAPFAKARLFVWPTLFAAAVVATYFAATGMLAVAVGAREQAAGSSPLVDLGIDLTAVGTTGFLWKRELDARDSRLRRIAFGARLAALRVTQLGAGGGAFGQTTTLADLRRGRGQARRVVLVAAPSDALKQSLAAAAASAAELLAADILVVPLLSLPPGRGAAALEAPPLEMLQGAVPSGEVAATAAAPRTAPLGEVRTQPPLPWVADAPDAAGSWPVAMPQAAAQWGQALLPELEAAAKQSPTAAERGLTIVLKKNGRVGTRRLGTPDWQARGGREAAEGEEMRPRCGRRCPDAAQMRPTLRAPPLSGLHRRSSTTWGQGGPPGST